MFGLSEDKNKQFVELKIRVESLDEEVQGLFAELGITPQQIDAFLGDRENFTDENWETLEKERQKLDQQLHRELKNVRNPKEANRAYGELNVGSQWLYVK